MICLHLFFVIFYVDKMLIKTSSDKITLFENKVLSKYLQICTDEIYEAY